MNGVENGTGVVVAKPIESINPIVNVGGQNNQGQTQNRSVEIGVLNASSSPTYKSLFFPADNGITGIELYQYDLATNSLKNPIDVRRGPKSSYPADMIEADGKIFFSADDGANGRELWIYDGATGIARIWNINVDNGKGSDPKFLTYLNGKIYFSADAGGLNSTPNGTVEGRELYYYDIASNRHAPVINHVLNTTRPGSIGSDPSHLMVQNGVLYFSAVARNGIGFELFKYDPVIDHETGPQMIANINITGTGTTPSESSYPQFMADFGGKIYFSANDGVHGEELWVYDKNYNTSHMVADINPGIASSKPRFSIAKDGQIFFSANNGFDQVDVDIPTMNAYLLPRREGCEFKLIGYHGVDYNSNTGKIDNNTSLDFDTDPDKNWRMYCDNRELMMVDTNNGIVRTVADPSIMGSTDPKFLTYKDGDIYFGGYRTLSFDSGGIEYAGVELWKYNLASQKATVVDNIARGVRKDSDPFWMMEANGMLYFGVTTQYNGREIWKSDGETPSIPLGNFNAGTGNFLPNKKITYTSNKQGYDIDYSYTTIIKTTW